MAYQCVICGEESDGKKHGQIVDCINNLFRQKQALQRQLATASAAITDLEETIATADETIGMAKNLLVVAEACYSEIEASARGLQAVGYGNDASWLLTMVIPLQEKISALRERIPVEV